MQQTAKNPLATPYRSGLPIDSIGLVDPPSQENPRQAQLTESYQSLVGCLNWLSVNTRPDLSAVVSFLASYSSGPLPGRISAAKYVLRYVNSTVDHGISFHSANATPLQSFIHFSFAHDREAYSDATGPLPHDTHLLTSYTDA